jgi:hypothetical protein
VEESLPAAWCLVGVHLHSELVHSVFWHLVEVRYHSWVEETFPLPWHLVEVHCHSSVEEIHPVVALMKPGQHGVPQIGPI